MSNFILGLDLGQAQDYTAIALLDVAYLKRGTAAVQPDASHVAPGPSGTAPLAQPVRQWPKYHVRGLERPPLGTPYPAIVERVRELVLKEELKGKTTLVADATGVGPPVIDLLRQAGLNPMAVTITGGDTVTKEDWRTWRVPKRDLATSVQVLLQTQRLRIAEGLEYGLALARELLNFRVKIDPQTIHDSYEAWREGMHDDLVLAVALACWWGEHGRVPPIVPAILKHGRW